MSFDRLVEQAIRVLEESLLEPGVRKSAAEMECLLADEFVEFGASGRVYGRRQVIDSLRAESPTRRSFSDFRVRLLAPGVALATYRALRDGEQGKPSRHSLRSSVWQEVGDR
jgi:hypothetical protein